MIKKIMVSLTIIFLMIISVCYYGVQTLHQPLSISTEEIIQIKAGTSVHSFSKELIQKKWINNRLWLRLYVELKPELTQLKKGTYKVDTGMSLLQLIDKIVKGKEHQYSITFIEGSTLKEWLVKLNQHPKLNKNTTFVLSSEGVKKLSRRLGLEKQNPEGLFFPDTYTFIENTDPLDILKRAQQRMKTTLAELWQLRDKNLPYKNAYQALIMASIVEKESGQVSEQATIASVFVNRLHKKMRLQTDPTVIYGLGDRYKGDIKYRHLREKTAYNTYKINGLPPTPIAMPGLTALKAVMHPEKSSFLYFVSRGNGYHKFSKSLAEHNKAVRKYILKK